MTTTVSSVQTFGPRKTWPPQAVYVGMPWRGSRDYGIPDSEGLFGKPWAFAHKPNWAELYLGYLVHRLATEPAFEQAVKGLHGKTLLCWCTVKESRRGHEVPCHGRILAEFAEMLNS